MKNADREFTVDEHIEYRWGTFDTDSENSVVVVEDGTNIVYRLSQIDGKIYRSAIGERVLFNSCGTMVPIDRKKWFQQLYAKPTRTPKQIRESAGKMASYIETRLKEGVVI